MGLTQALAGVGKRLAGIAPVHWLARAHALSVEADQAGATRRAPKVGDLLPDFELPDAEGRIWRSQALRERGPLVLLVQRGAWCPYCEATLLHYEQALHLFNAQGATVVAISPQKQELDDGAPKRQRGLVPSLHDDRLAYAERLGLAYRVTPEMQEAFAQLGLPYDRAQGGVADRLPATGTFLVGQDGRVLAAWASADYTRRPEVSQVLAALREHQAEGAVRGASA